MSSRLKILGAFVSCWKLTAVLPKDGGSKGGVDKSLHEHKWRLVGRHEFVGPPTWQNSCREGLLEFILPRVPDSRDVQNGRSTESVGRLLTCGVIWLIGWVIGMCFLQDSVDLDGSPLCCLKGATEMG